jgi:putative oxidoreductase
MPTRFAAHTIDRLAQVGDRLSSRLARLSFLGPTLARLTVGLVFVGTGWGKLHSLPDVTEFFRTLHIPAPGFHARLVAGTEFLGGLLILLGLGTRLVSLPLAFTMVVAILTAKRESIDSLTTLVGFEEWSYLVLFVWLALAGAGPLSVDGLFSRLRRRRRGAASCPPAAGDLKGPSDPSWTPKPSKPARS